MECGDASPGPGRNVGCIVDKHRPVNVRVRSPVVPKYPAEMPDGCAPPAERCTPELIVSPEAVVTVTVDASAAAIAVAWLIARMPCEPEVMLEPDIVVMATLPLPELEPAMP